MKLPRLYRRSSNKKIQEWDVVVEQDGAVSTIVVTHGQQNGVKQEKRTPIYLGKNIGRSNQTSPHEQACLEAKSKWKKQIDKGYVTSLGDVDEIDLRPMLAQSYDKHAKRIIFPAFIQPKLDGARCLAYPDGSLRSRKNKEWTALTHISEEVEEFMCDTKIILDGELYIHGVDFQSLIGSIKRDEPTQDTARVEYHVYDCYLPDLPELPFSERLVVLGSLGLHKLKHVKMVSTYQVWDKEAILKKTNEIVEDGYEGSIVRNFAGKYKVNGRSYDLQKVKSFLDEEFEIVGGEKDKNGECVFYCVTKDGVKFKVKPEGDSGKRKWYWRHLDDLIGKMLTVKFFEWTTSDKPVPRFPVGVEIRNYE